MIISCSTVLSRVINFFDELVVRKLGNAMPDALERPEVVVKYALNFTWFHLLSFTSAARRGSLSCVAGSTDVALDRNLLRILQHCCCPCVDILAIDLCVLCANIQNGLRPGTFVDRWQAGPRFEFERALAAVDCILDLLADGSRCLL